MSLMLCRQEEAEHPFYVEALGLNIYTSQELCYIIYHHPLLVIEDFVDENLMDFIRDELNMPYLSGKLEKWKKSGENQDELPVMVLQECFYYRASEVNDFRQHLANLRKKHPADFAKRKADYFFEIRQYGKAIPIYEKCMEFPRDNYVDDEYLGKLWCNLGSCYARMFQWEKGLQALERAYYYLKSPAVLQKMYYITLMSPRLTLKEKYSPEATGERKKQWDEELQSAREKAARSEEVEKLEQMFEKDPLKRASGAAKQIRRWKQEYRSMI